MKLYVTHFVVAILTANSSLATAESVPKIAATRCSANPLIKPELSERIGDNINGPSVIRAPDWLPNRLGRYYMYFSHHQGTYIRLAYSDELCGTWKIYEPGTLRLDQSADFVRHIASPDVHIDDKKRQIRMYFHGPRADEKRGQHTGVAVSTDGIRFEVIGSYLGLPYFRVFEWNDSFLAVAKRGNASGTIYWSTHATHGFTEGPDIIPLMRHAAILPWGDEFFIFFTRIGDAPERILMSRLSVGEDWRYPSISAPVEVLRPETTYEGTDMPIAPSEWGSTERAQQLRDPAIFVEGGNTYLFYSVAGESAIALAEIEVQR